MYHLGNLFHGIPQFHLPGVDSVSKKEYQDIPGGKEDGYIWLKIYHLQLPMSRNLVVLTSQNPLGPIGI
jgi:hypothetical protein